MKRIVYFSIIYLSLLSCIKKDMNISLNNDSIVDTTGSFKTYLALGDSYTIGESVPATDNYPMQTVNLLRNLNIKINDPDIIAVTGWTTTNLIKALNENPPKKNYSVVSLLIGVNNQYQHKSIDEYKTEFTELLHRAISYAGNNNKHVFVLSIPDYSATPFAANLDTAHISKEIDEFNDVNKRISSEAGVNYLNITPVSRKGKNNLAFTTNDGLHPSGYQYRLWSTLLAPVMQQALH